MRFDLIHSDYKGCIQNDGTVFKKDIYAEVTNFSAVSSYIFKPVIMILVNLKLNVINQVVTPLE